MVPAIPQAAEISTTRTSKPPPDPQDKPQPSNNGGGGRPRLKNVPSRYLSPSPSSSHSTSSSSTSSSSSALLNTSRRYPSPSLSRAAATSASNRSKTPSSLPNRSQSVDRRRPSPTPVTGTRTEMSAATKMLITSTRSLSVSFQGEAFSLPISKKKETTTTSTSTTTPVSHRKPTPERRRKPTPVRDQRENSNPVDNQQKLWPGASRRGNHESAPSSVSRNVDCECDDRVKKLGSKFEGTSMSHHSLLDASSSVSIDGRLGLDLGEGDRVLDLRDESKTRVTSTTDFTASDSDSVSSGSTNGAQERGERRSLQRNIIASAKFWQETNTRLRRLQDPGGSPRCSTPSARVSSLSTKLSQSKRFTSDSPLVLSPRGVVATRPASPSKVWGTAQARALSSPSRVRNGVSEQMNAYNRSLPSILCFSADIRRGKIGEDRVVDAHLLRLLYNRHLQWRFANARADSTFMVQRLSAERKLWNAWVSISDLRHSVTLKRIRLLLLRQKLKLASILKEQMGYLEEWSLLDSDHSDSVLGATEALKASTLRLPIIGKAVVDVLELKHAISSAVDVMHAMASSIFSLTSKVDEMNSVMAEMVNITAQEKLLLEQCQGFLSIVAAMQVKDCSMKTHIIQLSRKLSSQL
ncbi:Protein SNOWY COTYLEDON 3 [Hirschfeldia incana]|nr:Protein SNOWY COTYLEDON 3 [Hirschfeldia incana]